MTFTGCPETHDKTQAAILQMALIWMGNNGWVEKGRRFNGVLLGKESADE